MASSTPHRSIAVQNTCHHGGFRTVDERLLAEEEEIQRVQVRAAKLRVPIVCDSLAAHLPGWIPVTANTNKSTLEKGTLAVTEPYMNDRERFYDYDEVMRKVAPWPPLLFGHEDTILEELMNAVRAGRPAKALGVGFPPPVISTPDFSPWIDTGNVPWDDIVGTFADTWTMVRVSEVCSVLFVASWRARCLAVECDNKNMVKPGTMLWNTLFENSRLPGRNTPLTPPIATEVVSCGVIPYQFGCCILRFARLRDVEDLFATVARLCSLLPADEELNALRAILYIRNLWNGRRRKYDTKLPERWSTYKRPHGLPRLNTSARTGHSPPGSHPGFRVGGFVYPRPKYADGTFGICREINVYLSPLGTSLPVRIPDTEKKFVNGFRNLCLQPCGIWRNCGGVYCTAEWVAYRDAECKNNEAYIEEYLPGEVIFDDDNRVLGVRMT